MSGGVYRFPKADGEYQLYKGNRVWLKQFKFVSLFGTGRPFGVVVLDSIWPDLWVSVEVWDLEKFVNLENHENGVKGKAQCPRHLR
jgi:hypothetical protein